MGMTRNTTMAHVARAAVDAMAYQTRDVLEVMQEEAGLALDHAESGWRSGGQRDVAAVSGRPARRARFVARSCARRPRSAPPISPASRSATGTASTTFGATGRSIASLLRRWTSARGERLYAGWKKAVARSLAWAE